MCALVAYIPSVHQFLYAPVTPSVLSVAYCKSANNNNNNATKPTQQRIIINNDNNVVAMSVVLTNTMLEVAMSNPGRS